MSVLVNMSADSRYFNTKLQNQVWGYFRNSVTVVFFVSQRTLTSGFLQMKMFFSIVIVCIYFSSTSKTLCMFLHKLRIGGKVWFPVWANLMCPEVFSSSGPSVPSDSVWLYPCHPSPCCREKKQMSLTLFLNLWMVPEVICDHGARNLISDGSSVFICVSISVPKCLLVFLWLLL